MTTFSAYKSLLIAFLLIMLSSCDNKLEQDFINPPDEFKPMPFWHINGELTKEGIEEQLQVAKKDGFTGVSLLPLSHRSDAKPGTLPKYLSEAYFERYQDMINIAEELSMEIILYDDNDFPSGMAGGKMEENHPDYTMKRLDKIEFEIQGPQLFQDSVKSVQLMAAVAINQQTEEGIEISEFYKDGILKWSVPEGSWKIMLFPLVKDSFHKQYLCMDFMDTTAVRLMIGETYEKYKERFGQYFGNTIKTTFFDDVGFWRHPRNWTGSFNQKFEELHGYDPRPYYPALWCNIGEETEAVRNHFFSTRAELLAEGFPKLVAQWNEDNGLRSTGHPPGNYDPSPIDMNGDIFKFFRYTQIPLTDAIIRYQFGQNGHKLISSAADFYDRPLVATEIYGAYREPTFDSLMLYRPMMELFTRGVNMVIPHGMWWDPEKVHIPPLVSSYSDKIGPALPKYSKFVGRSSMLLRGGRRISEIAVVYPFEGLAGFFRFDNPENIRQGFYVAPETDYQTVSGWLSNEIRRDFTFVHPELLIDAKYRLEGGQLFLDNSENYQNYKTIMLTGSKIINRQTLQKLKDFYNQGGTLIATTMLPYKSTEIGLDSQIVTIVNDVFGLNPMEQNGWNEIVIKENKSGGKAIFIPNPTSEKLEEILQQYAPAPDLTFNDNPVLKTDMGKFNYIHKIKEGRHIYYFSNSSDEKIETNVLLRGSLSPQVWNPHTGSIDKNVEKEEVKIGSEIYTQIKLSIPPVKSLFILAKVEK